MAALDRVHLLGHSGRKEPLSTYFHIFHQHFSWVKTSAKKAQSAVAPGEISTGTCPGSQGRCIPWFGPRRMFSLRKSGRRSVAGFLGLFLVQYVLNAQ